MANLPNTGFSDSSAPLSGSMSSENGSLFGGGGGGGGGSDEANGVSVQQLIMALQNEQSKEQALQLLSKNRAKSADLAVLLWNSFGTIFILLKEIIATYHILSSPVEIAKVTTRVCNALALLQCVASHTETRKLFINANIPLYLYPFLSTWSNEKNIEYLRLTSLGVIGALVKANDAEVIHFLLKSEIFPCCLRSMEAGKDLSKTVATFIVLRILVHDEGLKYCCSSAERFFAVSHVLGSMVDNVQEEPSPRLLKHIIFCYLRLSENPRACDGLRCSLPARLRNNSFIAMLREEDSDAAAVLEQVLYNVTTGHRPKPQLAGDSYHRLF